VRSKIWLLSKKDKGYTKWETRMRNISQYLHDPVEDGGELHELVELSLAEPKLEDMLLWLVGSG